jgi:hypothetical protein
MLRLFELLEPLLLILVWIICVYSQFRMLANRKPGVRLFQARVLYCPFLMQFRGQYYLTSKGIFWRNLSWGCFAVFVIGDLLTRFLLD